MAFEEKLSFDDVLLTPKYSEISSRSEVNLSVDLSKGFKFDIPFLPSNMKSVFSVEMAEKIICHRGGLVLLHRFAPLEEQIKILSNLQEKIGKGIFDFLGVSVGIKDTDYQNLKIFKELGVKIFCIDVAHLDSSIGLQMVQYISKNYPEALLIAGNVATGEAAVRAFRAGADVIRIGIGNGSICSTRIQSAAGNPQLSAIMEIAAVIKDLEKELGRKLSTISDGSAREAGDCVKALCFTDMVMMGGYFAGCQESPEEEIEINGQKLKAYHGSSTHKDKRIEGVKALVHSKGSVLDLMQNLIEGVQSGCSYQNAKNLNELKISPSFIRITGAGLTESRIHDVIIPTHY